MSSQPEPDPAQHLTPADIRNRLTQLCHDINNPLSVISGNAQLFLTIAEGGTVDPELVHSVKDIDTAARKLEHLMEDLRRLRDELDRVLRDDRH